jgi:hypothetical protein
MTAKPQSTPMTADTEGDVVVFLIGMRVNRMWAAHRWLPVLLAMPRMLRELTGDKDSGLLSHVLLTGSPRTYCVIQHWRSEEDLYAYASDRDKLHRPAWAAFNSRSRKAGSAVGIWHETYVVPAGSHESIYFGMPPFGLAAAHGAVPVARRGRTGRERLAYGAPSSAAGA